MNILSPITQNKDAVNKAYIDGLLADYAKSADLGALASKDGLAFSELTSKPTTLAGYGITDALGKNETAASATKLATARTIWGQSFDGTKDISGDLSGVSILSGEAISNPTNATVTNKWRFIHDSDILYLQCGTSAGDTGGSITLSGYSGFDANQIRLHATATEITGNSIVRGTSLLSGAVQIDNSLTVQNGLSVTSGLATFTDHSTFYRGITVDGEQSILGIVPSGGTYPRFRVFSHSSGFYFQAATFDGTSQNGILSFSGMHGVDAAEIKFVGQKAIFSSSLEVGSHVNLFGQICGLHSTGAYHRYRIIQNVVGTFFQAGVNDGSSRQGTMYLSGIDNTMMTALHLRSDATTVYGSMSIPYSPLTLGSTLSVAGLATFNSGIKIANGQAISFLDSAGDEHKMTYDSTAGAFKVDGNFYATGQNAAGNAGESEGTVNGAVSNLEVKVSALSDYNQRSITSAAMETLTGLTVAKANNMLTGAYNKIIDNSGTYPSVWEYTANGTSTGIEVYFRQGDGFNIENGYSLTYTSSTATWTIIMGEI